MRNSLRVLAVLAAGVSTASSAAAEELVVNSFGGTFEEAFVKIVVEPFEKANGVDVRVVTAYSGDALAQIRAQKNNPPYDVVYISGGQEPMAAQEGLLLPIEKDKLTALDALYDVAQTGIDKGYGPAVVIGTTGLVYNKELVGEAPVSWEDLWRQDVAERVMLTDLSNSNGLRGFLMLNQVVGGTLENIEPGLAKIKELLDGGAFIITSTAELQQNIAQGTGVLGFYNQETSFSLLKAGLPVGYTMPKEGAPGFVITASLVANRPNSELAQKFIDFQLQPDIQTELAEALGYTPVNEKAVLSAETEAFIVRGEEAIGKLTFFDADEISKNRAAWVAAWNAAIAR